MQHRYWESASGRHIDCWRGIRKKAEADWPTRRVVESPAAARTRVIRKNAVELVRTHHADFGPTLAAEVLAERHGYPRWA
jgi:hypothetical protein